MDASEGILTARGGIDVARGARRAADGESLRRGVRIARIDYGKKEIRVGGHVVREGDFISLDGFPRVKSSTGR